MEEKNKLILLWKINKVHFEGHIRICRVGQFFMRNFSRLFQSSRIAILRDAVYM